MKVDGISYSHESGFYSYKTACPSLRNIMWSGGKEAKSKCFKDTHGMTSCR